MTRALVALLLCRAVLTAQTGGSTAAIQGSVVDSSGAAIPGVRVAAVQEGSGVARRTLTNEEGQFRFGGLDIGAWRLQLEKDGFGGVTVSAFPVSIGQTVTRRIEMQPGTVLEKLEVTEQPEALDPSATAASAALGGERIEEGPAQNRNYLNFVLVAPGVAASSGSASQRSMAGMRAVAVDSGFSFGGMRGRNNSLLIDGVDNRDETTGGNRVAIGLEMVQEFRVAGAAAGAELGGAAGGSVNMVTRSGANLWHGDFTFFAQNELFNARNPEVETGGRPRFRREQPGVSVMGPIRRDRTFFATAVEQQWESLEEWSDGPADLAPAINAALARPEYAAAGVRSVTRGLFRADSAQNEFSFKANHQAGLRHSLSSRYAFSRGRNTGDVLDVENFSDVSSRGRSLTTDHSWVAGWIWVPSPRVVNDLRVQMARRSAELAPNARGPMFEIPGVLTFGQGYRLDAARTEDHVEIVEAFNLAVARHQLSFGGSAHIIRLDARLANRYAGLFVFPTAADFLAARPDVFVQAFGDPRTRLHTAPYGVWVQDRWQAGRGLTVEAGLRYDRQRMPAGIPQSTRNVAPRVGLAWKPGGTAIVMRAGFGLFFDRYPLAFLNDAIQKDGSRGFEQFLAGAAAVRALSLARGGTLSAPLDGEGRSFYRADAEFPSTYSRKLSAGAELGLGKDMTLALDYNWVRGFHLPRVRNAALSLPAVWQLEQSARSAFHGLSVALNRRLTRNVAFLIAYNAGRTDDDASDFDEHPLDPANTARDWARSRQHQAHRVAASGLFELPGDISIAPILTAGSGRPINALLTTDAFRTGAYPLSARPGGLDRNPFFGPANINLDVRVMKTFRVKNDRARLQFGVEAFNLANHSNPLRVSPFHSSPNGSLESYRHAVEILGARQVQWLVQFEY